MEKVSEANVHLEGADLAIILRQLIENSGVEVRSGTSFQVGITEEGEVMAASINEETRNPPNNGEECPGKVDNEFDREVFIEEIRNLPCLWNTSIAAYRDRMFINCRHYPLPLYQAESRMRTLHTRT